MTDIFISYSSADRLKAQTLAAYFESKGYAVWYDKQLEPAEHYRDTITTKIDEARVVVCIWTPNSVRSEWCRAEANRARVSSKLIPVRSSDLEHDQIPLPFGEMHTISLSEEAQIERAVIKQLLAPRQHAPWYQWLWGSAKHEALSWASIIGAVMTLASGWTQFFKFAKFVNLLTGKFLAVTGQFWSLALFFVPKVTLYDCVLLNLWLFFFVLFVTSCSRDYVTPPLLSEKYLRDNLLGAIAAFIIIYIFSLTARQLQSDGQAESYVFNTMVTWVAQVLLGGWVPGARFLVMLVLIGSPIVLVLGLGYRFDPAKYASRMWRVIAGFALVGILNAGYQLYNAAS